MLVLTRKSKQQIRIGDNVVVTILKVKGQAVRVGIEAPQSVRVVRAELPLFDDATSSIEIAPGKSVVTGRPSVPRAPRLLDEQVAPTLRRGLGEHLAARHQRRQEGPGSASSLAVRTMESELGVCLRS